MEEPLRHGILLALFAAGCIDLDREPEWDTWRDTWRRRFDDTGAPSWRDTEASEDTRRCVVGTGETAWETLRDGDDLTVYWGPQGGWHVFGSVWCSDLHEPGGPVSEFWDPDNPLVTFQLRDAQRGVFGGYADLRRGMDNGTPPQLIGEPIVLLTSTCEENLDRDATLEVTVTDEDGEAFTDAVRVHLVPDPAHVPPPDTDPPQDSTSPDTDAADDSSP